MNIERIKAVGFGIVEPKGKFQKINFSRRPVGDNDILIDIMYAGICHSDIHVARGEWGDWNDKNVIPGHEIVGLVKQVGKDVTKFKIGDIAAIGCMVDSCGECANCKAGHEQYCNEGVVLTYDSIDWKHRDEITKGGYSTNYVLNENFAIKVSKAASDKLELIPSLCCAGITTYAPIVSANVEGKTCAVIGLGGLGHMAVKYLHSFGAKEVYAFDTVSKSDSEKDLDITFMMANERNIKKCFQKFDFILSTVPFDYDLDFYMSMVKKGGDVAIVGLPEYSSVKTNFSIKNLVLDYGNVKIWGSQIGGIPLTQECVDYSIKHKIYPNVEVINPDPKEIDEAYEKVRAGKVRFRYVIDMTKGEGVDKFKDGGKTKDKVESAAEKISRLMEEVIKPAAEAGNKTALRFLDIDKNFYTFTEEDKAKGSREEPGSRGNVYVASDPNSKYMIPTIQYRNGDLTFIGTDLDFNDPEVLELAIEFATPEDANFFAENYHNYPELVPMLQNKQYDKDMTLEDILKLNISDSAKEEITKAFAVGGEIKKEKKLNPSASVKVGDKEFDVEVADTDDKRKDGLSRVKELDDDEGMLFVFEEETEVPFTMADTSIDLDIVFIDDSGEVITVKSVKAFDETPVRCGGPFSFVLEVNYNSGIEEGDMVKFDDALSEEDMEKLKHSKMLVLNSEGDVLMRLEGGERIVSMIKTRQLIKAVLKAYKIDTDQYYKKVGRLIINEFDAQDNRDPQYVEKPDNKK